MSRLDQPWLLYPKLKSNRAVGKKQKPETEQDMSLIDEIDVFSEGFS